MPLKPKYKIIYVWFYKTLVSVISLYLIILNIFIYMNVEERQYKYLWNKKKTLPKQNKQVHTKKTRIHDLSAYSHSLLQIIIFDEISWCFFFRFILWIKQNRNLAQFLSRWCFGHICTDKMAFTAIRYRKIHSYSYIHRQFDIIWRSASYHMKFGFKWCNLHI